MTRKPNIGRAYIHGALMSPISFNYIRSRHHHVAHEALPVYDAATHSVSENIRLVYEEIKEELGTTREFDLVCHSMGGIIGLTILKNYTDLKIRRLVTLSTPFTGVKGAFWMKYILPRYHLFGDISTSSNVVKRLKDYEVQIPTLNIITTWGTSFFGVDDNDGVVSVESQRGIKGPKVSHKEIAVNHMEVLLEEEVASEIKRFLNAD